MNPHKNLDLFRGGAEYQPHPLAEILPEMAKEEFAALVKSIHKDGLHQPIVIFEGKVLDGRHRLRACVEAGVEPRFVAFAGADAFAYVVAANVNRRHLNDGQRALSAARLATLRKGQKASNAAFAVTQTEAAKLFNVSTDTIQRARLILEDGHQGMVEKVNAGTMSINAAYRILRPVRREESSSAALLTKPDNDNESRQGSRAALIRDMEKVRLGAAGIVAMLSSERADVSSDDIVHTVQAIHRISKKWASVLESR